MSTPTLPLPEKISTVAELDEVMTRPPAQLVAMMGRLRGDLAILGIAGKMGVTLGGMAARACREAGVKKRILGVARFSDPASRKAVEEAGVEAVACDLLDPEAVARLPLVENVIFMAGKKFGTTGAEAATWAMNTLVPGNVARHYRKSRIVAFSTGCVYPLPAVPSPGCSEEDPPDPVGEYSQSCLGRERVFAHGSRTWKTPLCLFRLNYAIDLRYGVLLEIGSKVWKGEPVDLGMGYANVIWQGDANARALLCLEHCACPEAIMNVTGPETVSIRWLAAEFGRVMGKAPRLQGQEGPIALLNNAAKSFRAFGYPEVPLGTMIRWVAHWLKIGGETLDKPTHFEVKDGKF